MNGVKPHNPEPKSRSGPSSGSFKLARVEVQELAALAGPDVISGPGTDLLSDELLIERVLAGETEHYEVLMRRNCARLYRLARGIDGSSTDAEEVVRETFVRAYENLPGYDRRLRFADWLARIVIHGAVARLKRSARRSVSERTRSQQQDLVRQLELAADALPDDFRIAFTLCTLDQLSADEVSETLGIPVGRVKVHAFRGRLKVRRALGMRSDDAEARAFGLHLSNADAIVGSVLSRLGASP
jgi:RNA polymerase sigma-70 factor, ECF subfamily